MKILVTGGYGMMDRTIHSIINDNYIYNNHEYYKENNYSW